MEIGILLPGQADLYLEFLRKLDQQSEYMHYRPGERPMNVDGMFSRLKKMKKQGNNFVMVATDQNRIIGYFSVNGGNSQATKHSAEIATGILQEYQGKGIGRLLLNEAEREAEKRDIVRFSCSVVQENPAVAFYFRMGFVVCGHSTISFLSRDNRLLNEWRMEYFLCIDPE